jgi:hypothetical protein
MDQTKGFRNGENHFLNLLDFHLSCQQCLHVTRIQSSVSFHNRLQIKQEFKMEN